MKKNTKWRKEVGMLEEKIYCRYMGEHSQRETGPSGWVPSRHDQPEMGHLGREGVEIRSKRGKTARRPKVQREQAI